MLLLCVSLVTNTESLRELLSVLMLLLWLT